MNKKLDSIQREMLMEKKKLFSCQLQLSQKYFALRQPSNVCMQQNYFVSTSHLSQRMKK